MTFPIVCSNTLRGVRAVQVIPQGFVGAQLCGVIGMLRWDLQMHCCVNELVFRRVLQLSSLFPFAACVVLDSPLAPVHSES